MKNTLIALAVLAASGAAVAQSSVTIYGRVNTGLVKDTSGQRPRIDAANGTSQLGFRGVEDLGGGLKGTFDLRHRFSVESGGNDGGLNQRPFWQGVSVVGLSGGFGSVNIGRQLTALQLAINSSDPWGTETVGSTAFLPTNYSTDRRQVDGAGLGRTDSITYTTPNFGGFVGSLSFGPRVSAGAANSVIPVGTVAPAGTTPLAARTAFGRDMVSTWLQFGTGPFLIGGGFERNRSNDEIASIIGSWNFGFARVMGGYARVDNATATTAATVTAANPAGTTFDANNYNLGVSVPLGAATLKAGYAVAENDATSAKVRKASIGAEYNLSKRTYVYTTYARNRGTGITGAAGTTARNAYDLGVSHSF